MKRYRGNEKVPAGLYLNLRELSFTSMEEEGHLPGGERDVYWRVPVVAMLLAAPLVGLAYVVFLPFIGFAMLAWVGMQKIAEMSAVAAAAAARVLRPAWQPARAFLSRAKAAKKRPRRRDLWLDAVRRELRKRRGEAG